MTLRETPGFVVAQYKQVLLNGTWDSDDCEWDWDPIYTNFEHINDAKKYFKRLVVSDDIPIIRIYSSMFQMSGDCIVSSTLDDIIYEKV